MDIADYETAHFSKSKLPFLPVQITDSTKFERAFAIRKSSRH